MKKSRREVVAEYLIMAVFLAGAAVWAAVAGKDTVFRVCAVLGGIAAFMAAYYGIYIKYKTDGSGFTSQTGKEHFTGDMDIGAAGEYALYKSVRRACGRKMQYIFNCLIPDGSGGSTEIDMIAVGRQGVFVYESKNYLGNVYGDTGDLYWTEQLGNSSRRFYNPVRQNEGHIKKLGRFLPSDIPVHSVIAFGTELSESIVTGPVPPDTYITSIRNAGRLTRSIRAGRTLSDAEVKRIARRISEVRLTNRRSAEEHIAAIKRRYRT